jgi:glycosyltransferase involved in cell wall biosynthesis
MRWLVISPYLPHPEIGHGGGTAVLQLCEELARHHETTLLCFKREDEAGREAYLRARGVTVRTIPWRSDQARGLTRLALIADRARVLLRQRRSDRPFMVEKYDRAELRRAIDRVLDAESFDVVQVEYSFLAPAAGHARRHPSRPAVLLNTHEIASLPRERELERARDPMSRSRANRELNRWRAFESTLCEAADRVLCVTEQDRQRLADHLGGGERLATVPLGYRIDDIAPAHTEERDPPRLLFVGSFAHPPNLAGARILVEEIMPLVSAVRPDIRLDVVGRGADTGLIEAAERHAGRVRMHGFVADLDPLWARCSIFVAPLFTGGGIKIKVLEAMARGACIVSTPIGVEGIDESGDASTIADSAEDFAARILDLALDPERRALQATRAREKLVREFSWASIVERLEGLARDVLDPAPPDRSSGRGPVDL